MRRISPSPICGSSGPPPGATWTAKWQRWSSAAHGCTPRGVTMRLGRGAVVASRPRAPCRRRTKPDTFLIFGACAALDMSKETVPRMRMASVSEAGMASEAV